MDETPAAPGRRSRRRLWLTVTAVGVLAATAFGVVFADNFAALGAYRYSPPEEFDGLRLSPTASAGKRTLRPGSGSGVSSTTYLSADGARVIWLAVSEQHTFLPSAQIDDVIVGHEDAGLELTDVHEVDPGERGGVMKCGRAGAVDGDGERQEMGLCTWVDGSMWAVYTEGVDGAVVNLDTVTGHAREFRRLAEVPA
ncbi:hypothetical protein [Kitasatospora sp. NPDC092286]|uniref:hypothetical protein n=1 Tax=Kitasatospora sp. NPDC092286 TaxID=3364087 RepID=UPI00382CB251